MWPTSRERGPADPADSLPADLHGEIRAIREGLSTLCAAKPIEDVFGANGHLFHLEPALREQAVREFEAEHRIQLPAGYRAFLTCVGNGDVGPAYGLFRLGEMDDGEWAESDTIVGTPSAPFPLTEAWNDMEGRPQFDEAKASDPGYEDAYKSQLDAWECQKYWNPATMNGAIPICHLGCALREWLVVTGSEVGNVWGDGRADYRGLWPIQAPGLVRVSFLQWYRLWLDKALADLTRRNDPGA